MVLHGWGKGRVVLGDGAYVYVHFLEHGDAFEGVLESDVLRGRNDDNP